MCPESTEPVFEAEGLVQPSARRWLGERLKSTEGSQTSDTNRLPGGDGQFAWS